MVVVLTYATIFKKICTKISHPTQKQPLGHQGHHKPNLEEWIDPRREVNNQQRSQEVNTEAVGGQVVVPYHRPPKSLQLQQQTWPPHIQKIDQHLCHHNAHSLLAIDNDFYHAIFTSKQTIHAYALSCLLLQGGGAWTQSLCQRTLTPINTRTYTLSIRAPKKLSLQISRL